MKKSLKITLIAIFILLSILMVIRANSLREIDDINPSIYCEEKYLNKASILWVIPLYNNTPVYENKKWCKEILELNKTLGMHGVQHYFKEFEDNLTEEYIEEGINAFEKCFNQTPTLFKPPKLALSEENKILLEKHNLTIKLYTNQIFHKVYHCSNSGTFPNWFHDLV